MRMQGYCDVYKWTILKRTSPEVKCLHLTSSRREMCTLSVSNVIYHKFSHGAAFYTLNGKNVNVMLEYIIIYVLEEELFWKQGTHQRNENSRTKQTRFNCFNFTHAPSMASAAKLYSYLHWGENYHSHTLP